MDVSIRGWIPLSHEEITRLASKVILLGDIESRNVRIRWGNMKPTLVAFGVEEHGFVWLDAQDVARAIFPRFVHRFSVPRKGAHLRSCP